MNTQEDKILTSLLSGRTAKRYEGRQVVVVEGKVYILPYDDKKSKEVLNKLMSKHPKSTPTITFVTKHGTYIYPSASWLTAFPRAF